MFGHAFRFVATDVDETQRVGEPVAAMVERLSRAKAELGARNLGDALVVGADTVVAMDGAILGKPKDADDATRMLKLLRARAHTVFSGITVLRDARALTQVATTPVWMRAYTDAEIAAFVATGEPLDKAAAYAIQNSAFHPVARIDGCYANVMGLPLCHLFRALVAFGVPLVEPAHACQAYLKIACPIAQSILHPRDENLKSGI